MGGFGTAGSQARGLLGPLANGNDYADARTELAIEQALRIRQVRLEAEGNLIEAEQVRKILVDSASAFRARLQTVEKRLRAKHPNLPPAVYAFVRQAHEDALGLMSNDMLKLAPK